MSPVGAIFVPFPPKTGTNMLHPRPPPQSLNWSPTLSNMYRERNCCMTHVAKATDVRVLGRRLHLPRGVTPRRSECDIFYFLLAASICCHRGCPRCDTVTHACLQSKRGLYLKADLNFCIRPYGGRLRPQHHKELLLRVGILPCAPTYNSGGVQHVVFDRFGLAQPHECSSKAATCHANSTMKVASNIIQ